MIAAIVEGRGDLLALPRLVARAIPGFPSFPCISTDGKSNIVRLENGFEQTVLRQRRCGYHSFLVLMDADRDRVFPPYSSLNDERVGMEDRARRLERDHEVRVLVWWAILCFESWLIGGLIQGQGICGLKRRFGRVPPDTETEPVDPKKWIEERLKRGDYTPHVQECLAAEIDVSRARNRNRSLDNFLRQFPHFVQVQGGDK